MSLDPAVKEESMKEEFNDDGMVMSTFFKQYIHFIDILCPDLSHKKKPNSEGVSAETVHKEMKSYQMKEELVDPGQELESANKFQDAHFKEEPISDSEDVTAAATAELYANHQVKEELVVGPEHFHPLETAQSSEVSNTPANSKENHLDSNSACSSNELFVCSICSRKFKDKDSCIEHLLKHTPVCLPIPIRFYTCHVCNEEFSANNAYLKHRKSHEDRKPHEIPYSCNICNEEFFKTNDLVLHKKTHMVAVSFQCEICKKEYLYEKSLKRHKKLHDSAYIGKKRNNGKRERSPQFTCDICNKKLSSKYNLSVHIMIHSGEKPYRCEVCGRRFIQINNMMRHKVSMHKNILST